MKKFTFLRSTLLLLLSVLLNAAMFAQMPETFTNAAHIDDAGSANGVAVGADGTVYIANQGDGLRAYTYDGSSFTNTAHIDNGGNASGVAVGADGTVFLTNLLDGLRAYTYDGSSFTNTAHINSRRSLGVAVGADGTVFIANHFDGLRAYTYNGSSFTLTAHISNGSVFGVAVGADGTVFIANADGGLRAYTYDGSSFTLTAHIDNGGLAYAVAVGADATVFLANADGGLRAYTYDGSSFTNTAHIDNGGYAQGVAVGTDGTVFIANHDDGLRAYTYSGYLVCEGDVTLSTQAEVDDFICTEVTGTLLINGPDITDLSPLSSLTSVGGNLFIFNNSSLTNLNGLSSLTSVGGNLFIDNNSALTNLNGLSSLTSVGGYLGISKNSALTNLDGLSSLTSVGGNLFIDNNSALTNLNGLSSLTSVGGDLFIDNNSALTNLNGLSSLTSVGGSFWILQNAALTEFCGLNLLLSVGGLIGNYIVSANFYNPAKQDIIDGGHCLVGDLVINEIMNNPNAVYDSEGEWFEVYNTSDSDIDMIGMTIRDDDSDNHEIATSLVVPAGGYVVLGRNADAGANGGVAVDYEYENFQLANAADEVVIEVFESIIDQVSYDNGASFPDPTGASMSLDPGSQNATDNDNGANWCEGSSAYGAGDFGTPGAENDVCCDIQITSVTVSDEGCPGANDGYISIGASCTTCTDMEFSIDGSTYQSSNEFTNVSSGIYSLYARDVSNYNCLASTNTNINPGVDYTQPVITCPADITVSNDAGSCDAMVTFSVTASDNCDPSVTIVSTPASGSTFQVGTTTVTNTATDASGNSSSCSFDVTVNDTEAPVLAACPANINQDTDAGVCEATVYWTEPTASDNCTATADLVWTKSHEPGELFSVGTTTVTYTATDIASNTSLDCSFDVTVTDNEAPTLTAFSTPITLWPPNHKYETISMSQLFDAVSDNCNDGLTIDDVYITSVSSDEPENGSGDGNTVNDIVIDGYCSSVKLRKERDGGSNGRVYTVNLAVDDGNDNTGTASVLVYVPISKNGTSVDDGVDYSESCTPTKSSFFANTASDENQLINYPNPFNGSTTITFTLTETENTTLKVYDTYGKLVATLFDGMAESGQKYTLEFSAGNLPKGIYVYHLQSGNNVSVVKKMILMK